MNPITIFRQWAYLLSLTALCCMPHMLVAQYATSGVGAYKSEIYWLVWPSGGGEITEGYEKDFSLPDGSTLNITFTNVNDTKDDYPRFWTHESYSGSKHDDYYYIQENREDTMMIHVQSPDTFRMTMTFTRTGGVAGLPMHIIYADAEDNKEHEYTQATTNGDSWQFLELMNYSSTATIKNNNNQYVIFRDSDKTLQQKGYFPSFSPGGIYISQNATELDIELHSPAGFSGMAFGIWFPFDYGDAQGYGTAGHLKSTELTDGYNPNPGTADTLTFAEFFSGSNEVVMESPTLLMGGSVTADLSTNNNSEASADGSDGAATFPDYDGSGTYQVDVEVTNTTGGDAYLVGYMDFDGNGDFTGGNEQSATVTASSSGTYTVTFTSVPGQIFSRVTGRFRLSSNKIQAESPTGFAVDGEVEDYKIAQAIFPVSLISFDVQAANDQARVRWTTAEEVNSSHFDVQRSLDGISWQNLSQVPAQGNSNQITNYEVWDDQPYGERSYYRLRQVDLDGRTWHSSLVQFLPREANFQVWCLNQQLCLNSSRPVYEVNLFDLSGRCWMTKTFPSGLTGFNSIALPDGCPDQVYVQVSGQYGMWLTGQKLWIRD